GGANGRLRGGHCGLRGLVRGDRVVAVLQARELLLVQRYDALALALGLPEVRELHAELGSRALRLGEKRRRVDLEQHFARFDRRAFLVETLEKNAGDASSHFDFSHAAQRRDVFERERQLVGFDLQRRDGDWRRCHSFRRGLLLAAGEEGGKQRGARCRGPPRRIPCSAHGKLLSRGRDDSRANDSASPRRRWIVERRIGISTAALSGRIGSSIAALRGGIRSLVRLYDARQPAYRTASSATPGAVNA